MFPSPCGDKLKFMDYEKRQDKEEFPSPCGDKLKCIVFVSRPFIAMFPSPCGDKLKSVYITPDTGQSSFRPLAGIS